MEATHWSVSSPQTIDVDGVRALTVGIVAGRVDVLVHDESTTRVEVSDITGAPIEINQHAGSLEVKQTTPAISRGRWPIDARTGSGLKESAVISIAVPEGTTISLSTVNGDGLVCGTENSSLSTVSGSLMADDTQGSLRVNTVSGEVIVRHHTGSLVARSVSGEVTASGFLESIRTNSVTGDTSLDLLGSPHDLVAKTVSGEVTIRVPADVGIDIAASTASGTLTVNDRTFSGLGKKTHSEGPSVHRLQARTSSVSGNVSLFHSSPPRQAQHDGGEQFGGIR